MPATLRLMRLTIEIDHETDGRYIAEVMELPGVMAFGDTEATALSHARSLALRVVAEQIEHGELASVEAAPIRFERREPVAVD